MGKKRGKFKRKENSGPVKTKAVRVGSDDEDMMNDEIDACVCLLIKHMMFYKILHLCEIIFSAIYVYLWAILPCCFYLVVHKNRDIIPLNINEDMEESDEDNEHPVFDFEVVPGFLALAPSWLLSIDIFLVFCLRYDIYSSELMVNIYSRARLWLCLCFFYFGHYYQYHFCIFLNLFRNYSAAHENGNTRKQS